MKIRFGLATPANSPRDTPSYWILIEKKNLVPEGLTSSLQFPASSSKELVVQSLAPLTDPEVSKGVILYKLLKSIIVYDAVLEVRKYATSDFPTCGTLNTKEDLK